MLVCLVTIVHVLNVSSARHMLVFIATTATFGPALPCCKQSSWGCIVWCQYALARSLISSTLLLVCQKNAGQCPVVLIRFLDPARGAHNMAISSFIYCCSYFVAQQSMFTRLVWLLAELMSTPATHMKVCFVSYAVS